MIATRSDFRQAVCRIVARWWRGLDDDRGTRASLRRADCTTDVFGVPGFHHDILRPLERLLDRRLTDSEAEWVRGCRGGAGPCREEHAGQHASRLGAVFRECQKGN